VVVEAVANYIEAQLDYGTLQVLKSNCIYKGEKNESYAKKSE
jgi:hypothetical protein